MASRVNGIASQVNGIMDGAVEPQSHIIDLTLDDAPDEAAPAPAPAPLVNAPLHFKEEPEFVSTVAHRRLSPRPILPKPAATIPQKRKSPQSSEDPLVSSRRPTPILNNVPRPSTPKSAPGNVEVVITSPPSHRKLIKEGKAALRGPIGISEEFFPLDVEENARATQRRYPTAKADRRHAVPFPSARKPLKPSSLSPSKFLRHMQMQKLRRIDGQDLSFDIDDEKLAILSSNFGFINEYKLQEGVTPVPSDFIAGCDCDGPCDEFSCDCLDEELNSDQKIVPYHLVDGRLVLRPDFLKRKSLISECSSKCSCSGAGQQCWNHVVQRGRSVRPQIFDTGERGFGLRSIDPIITGQFIDLYLGEVITRKEADAREMADEQGQSYLFSLDWIVDDDDIYVVDGQKFGSPTRFMNHSCNPNCKIIPVTTTNSADTRLYYLAFFAIRDIPAGTELTFDYNPSWNGSTKFDPDAVPCLCGERKCRGQLWPNARKQGQKA